MKARIEELLAYLGLNAGRFADEIGIQRSAMSHILNERNKPSLDVLQKIMARYPDIEPNWLLNGLGSMTRNISSIPPVLPKKESPITFLHEEIEEIKAPPKEEKASEKMPFAQHLLNFEAKNTKSEPFPSHFASLNTDKKLVKVILFYDDKSFVEYKAE